MLNNVMNTIKNKQLGNTYLLKLLPIQARLDSGPITTKNAQLSTPVRAKKLYATDTANLVSSIAEYTKLPGSVVWLPCTSYTE
jgi:hypothetical protein